MANIVEFKNVNMSFGNNKVLKDIDLEIEKGKFYTLLGPSGCGKSTILKLIGGFLSPTSGDVLLDDKIVNDLPANKRHVNTVFQDYALFPHMNVFENVAFGLKIKNEKKKVEDMIVYPNDKVKERFQKILNGEPVQSKLFRTKPIIISKDYAFSFCTESIYGDMIERAALTDEFASKYANVVQIMANIDTIYKIDNVSKQLYPIDFGVVEDSLSKTVMRKVKAIYEIMKNLSSDEHATLMGEVYKITRTFTDDKISYISPAS